MDIDTICMSSGGIKGIAFVGALDYLNNEKLIDILKINNWVGTSVGSILSLLFLIGYTPAEIGDFIIDFNFTKMNLDISVENVFTKYGINNGERFEFVIKSFLKNKLGVEDINFYNLYQITKKNLIIIGTNFSKSCEEAFSWDRTPDMSVITAIRISSSVPIFFTPVLYNGCYYVDGGIKNIFPINYCNEKTTLGLCIKYSNHNNHVESISNIATGCLNIVTNTIGSMNTNIIFNENIMQIDNCVDEFIKFELSIEMKLQIIKSGQICAQQFINEYPVKICKDILNKVIKNIENDLIIKNTVREQSTQTEDDLIIKNTVREQSTQTEDDLIIKNTVQEQSSQSEDDLIIKNTVQEQSSQTEDDLIIK